MNPNMLSQSAKLDLATSIVMLICILVVATAIELSAPVIAGLGAASAAFTGVARLVYDPKKK